MHAHNGGINLQFAIKDDIGLGNGNQSEVVQKETQAISLQLNDFQFVTIAHHKFHILGIPFQQQQKCHSNSVLRFCCSFLPLNVEVCSWQ